MNRKYVFSLLMFLSLIVPFMAKADRFYIDPVDFEIGKTETIQFILENSQDYCGFQAEVRLPDGLNALKGSDGELEITLSSRADGGSFMVNSNVLPDGSLIMGAFSATHKSFTGNDGVLVDLKVSVADSFKGGSIEVYNIIFIDNQNKDVDLESTSSTIGVTITGIILSESEISISEGQSKTLTATITPQSATDKTITWTSSDPTVATVSSEGVVSAVKAGTATIIATTANGKTATCTVTVAAKVIEVTGITLSKTELNLVEDETATLIATVAPVDATDKSVTWTSSDNAVATVDVDGKVTALKAGTATITATTANGKTASCAVTVVAKVIEATGVTLNLPELSLTEGETANLVATVAPADATDKTVTWTSSDEAVATVDAEGKVTAVKVGNAVITVTTVNGKTATCTVTVAAKVIEVTGITLSKTELNLVEDETATLTATVAPADATDKTVTWTSSDNAVATVDVDGKVTAVKAGTATITVTTANGKTATCAVTVAAKVIEATGVTLNLTELSLTEGDTAVLIATVAPADATDKTVTWTSSDNAVATVDAEGKVTAVKAGTATITVTTANGKTASCAVTVEAKVIMVESLTIDPTEWSGVEGSEFKITATVLPEDATDKTLSFESSDTTIATVDEDGNVKVLKNGSCVITVSTTDGSHLTAECVILGFSGVEAIFGSDAAVDVYDMNGTLIKKDSDRTDLKQLTPGVYILRHGNATVKAVIR